MTHRQKQEARRRKRDWRFDGVKRDLPKLRDGLIVDYSDAPAKLEAAIKAGKLLGVTAIYKLKGDTPGKVHLGMHNAGLTIEEVFDLVCVMRRTMMASYAFVDLADSRLTEEITDKTIDDLADKALRK